VYRLAAEITKSEMLMKLQKHILHPSALSLLLVAVCVQARADTLRVLFLGNSYTYVNDLPGLFAGLAQSAGRTAVTDENTPGGYTLTQHSQDSTSLAKIRLGTFHYVVLQEQSQIPTIQYWRYNAMYPAARFLDSLIRSAGESTAFYMTWGRKYGGIQVWGGDSSPPFRDYFEMQDSLRSSYTMIADELSATLVPAGMAWRLARLQDSLADLWQSDSSHPTLNGSYLTACVFYAKLFRSNPVGLSFTGGLTAEQALLYQQLAWQIVSGITEDAPSELRPSFSLRAFPNPFSHAAYIGPCAPNVDIVITDVLGRKVANLRTGNSTMTCWNGRDGLGRKVPAGVYLAFIRQAGSTACCRFVLSH
jgi:hypothetical protein